MEATDKIAQSAAAHWEITVRGVSKVFSTRSGPVEALSHVDMTVASSRFVCIVGPSGCGKSTLLRMVAGLASCEQGEILFRGAPQHGPCRQIGMVFQEYSLFPWLNVVDNTGIGLEFGGMPKDKREQEARRYLAMVGLEKFALAMPHELSGGMRQRVAIARALTNNPDVLLMDEPFGALDPQGRRRLQHEFAALQKELGTTVVLVTHDLREAAALADRIAVLSKGAHLEQVGTPEQVLHAPANDVVADFVADFS